MSSRRPEYISNDEVDYSRTSFGLPSDYPQAGRTPFTVAEKPQKIQLRKKPQEVRQAQQPPLKYHRGQPTQAEGITVAKSGTMDQLSLILGGTYVAGGLFGTGAAIWSLAAAKKLKRPRYLISNKVSVSRYFTEGFKIVSHYGNTAAAIGLAYLLISRGTTYIFQEELEYVPKVGQNAIFGFLAGALCNSIKGRGPALLTGAVGALVAPIIVAGYARLSQHIKI